MTAALTEQQLAQRVDAAKARVGGLVGAPTPASPPSIVRPLSESAESLLEVLDNTSERFMLGLPEIDVLTRGFGPKELILVVGFSHSGKTQLLLTSILRNLHKRILVFSMDDSAEMILTNLVCMYEDISAENLEHAVRDNSAMGEQVREHARKTFQNLLIVDTPMRISKLDAAVAEATELWGDVPDMVAIDYLQSMQGVTGDQDTVRGIVQSVKRWVKDKSFPTMLLHQGTRTGAKPGQPITMMSGAFAGEQEATVLLGVRRQRDRDDENFTDEDRAHHANTVTLHVVKNKRPPARRTPYEGIDFLMVPQTGLIKPLRYVAADADDAVRHVQEELA